MTLVWAIAVCAALEVGEATAWAGPVAGTRAVLGWRERREERRATGRLGGSSAVKDLCDNNSQYMTPTYSWMVATYAAAGWRDLNGAVIESAPVHAEGFCGLGVVLVISLI